MQFDGEAPSIAKESASGRGDSVDESEVSRAPAGRQEALRGEFPTPDGASTRFLGRAESVKTDTQKPFVRAELIARGRFL